MIGITTSILPDKYRLWFWGTYGLVDENRDDREVLDKDAEGLPRSWDTWLGRNAALGQRMESDWLASSRKAIGFHVVSRPVRVRVGKAVSAGLCWLTRGNAGLVRFM